MILKNVYKLSVLIVISFFCVLITPVTAVSLPLDNPTYYVSPAGDDANPGTDTSPWRTIQKAASTLTAGETAILMDGTYTEDSIQFANDGVAGYPITIKAQNKWGAILASTSGCLPGIHILKSYITIDGIRFSVSPNNVRCSTPGGNSWNAALWCSNATYTWPSVANPNSITHHCTVRNTLVDQSDERDTGFKWVQDYALFENNVVHNTIEAFNSYASIIRNNTVYDGDRWGSYIYGKGGVRSMQIYNNVVYMDTRAGQNSGIALGGVTGSAWFDPTTHIEAYNSVAYNNVVIVQGGNSATRTLAMGMLGAVDSAMYNNILIGGQIYIWPGGAVGFPPRPPTLNPTFKNNIILCNGGPVYDIPLYTAGALTVDYNNFYNCTQTPNQTHAISGDPQFVDASADWHLQAGSPGQDSGVPVTFTGYLGETIDISHDKDGVARTAPWDLSLYNVLPPPLPSDIVGPVISGITSSAITESSAIISWTTNEASDSQIDYGTSSTYGFRTTLDPSLQNTHSQHLVGLSESTIYHYRVKSVDAAGNAVSSADQTFGTLGFGILPVIPPPVPPPPPVPLLIPPPIVEPVRPSPVLSLSLLRTLSIGAKGTDVTQLQNFLIGAGYLATGNNSGYYGNLTKIAVQKYQCSKINICSGNELTTGYGMVGQKTRAALSGGSPATTTTSGLTSAQKEAIQTQITMLLVLAQQLLLQLKMIQGY